MKEENDLDELDVDDMNHPNKKRKLNKIGDDDLKYDDEAVIITASDGDIDDDGYDGDEDDITISSNLGKIKRRRRYKRREKKKRRYKRIINIEDEYKDYEDEGYDGDDNDGVWSWTPRLVPSRRAMVLCAWPW